MESKRKDIVIGSIVISIIIIVIVIYYGFIKLAELKGTETKNEPIGGMYGVSLGDNIETLFKNPNLFGIDKYSETETKYDYVTASISGNNGTSNQLIVYATKDSGTIYEIIYKNYIENNCEMADASMTKLIKQYGLGNYNVIDAVFNMKTIVKDNRSIYVSCVNEFFDSRNKVRIYYNDSLIEDTLNAEYQQYKIKKADVDLKLN